MTEYEMAIKLADWILDRPYADPDDDLALLSRQFLRCVEREESLRIALLPFGVAAGRPGRLLDCMTDAPLSDEAVVGLGIRVKDWKRDAWLTGSGSP